MDLKYLKASEFLKLSKIDRIKILKKIAQGQIRIKEDRSK